MQASIHALCIGHLLVPLCGAIIDHTLTLPFELDIYCSLSSDWLQANQNTIHEV